MIDPVVKTRDGASAFMLAVSALFHVLVGVAVVFFSSGLFKKAQTEKPKVSMVKLVSGTAEEVLPEILAPGSSGAGPSLERKTEPEEKVAVAANKGATLKTRRLKTSKKDRIKLRKRKRKIARVKKPLKASDDSKKDEKAQNRKAARTEKEVTSDKLIEQELAQIRRKLEQRNQPNSEDEPGRIGAASDPATVDGADGDRDLSIWLEGIRNSIKSNWSVLREDRQFKVAVIGVSVSEKGHILQTTVEESSGDEGFDRSAMRAVYHAAPFPPIPAKARDRVKAAGGLALRFSPTGIK
jgi:colicin import membrane protein